MNELPAGTVILWDDESNIPDGWEVYTAAVGKMIRGASVDADLEVTGGSASHYHTQTTVNSRSAHNHGGYGTVGYWSSVSGSDVATYSPGVDAAPGHGHTGGTFNIASANSHSHTIGNTGSADNNPLHIDLVPIIKL